MCLVATNLNNAAKRSDTDAVGMVKCGALLIYTEILNIGSPEEQTKAADGICIFSWTCWERSRKERGCLEGTIGNTSVIRWHLSPRLGHEGDLPVITGQVSDAGAIVH
ncbi:hypothetical protein LSAT2_031829 [Lamellibrachia satsuma]|nr:hypothetical protein LSAT2_031829 [Lamellibrachia satsuma]